MDVAVVVGGTILGEEEGSNDTSEFEYDTEAEEDTEEEEG